MSNMMSLYDYLGHAAGGELGKEVAEAAAKAKVGFEIREVSNPKYTGKIMLYPEAFLKEYFQMKQSVSNISTDWEDELPF
jgi:transposase